MLSLYLQIILRTDDLPLPPLAKAIKRPSPLPNHHPLHKVIYRFTYHIKLTPGYPLQTIRPGNFFPGGQPAELGRRWNVQALGLGNDSS